MILPRLSILIHLSVPTGVKDQVMYNNIPKLAFVKSVLLDSGDSIQMSAQVVLLVMVIQGRKLKVV